MPSLLAAAGLKNFSGSVNLVFDTQGQSGLLMASGSVDQTNTYVFEVAPRGTTMNAGKNLSYWSTADGDDTMVTICTEDAIQEHPKLSAALDLVLSFVVEDYDGSLPVFVWCAGFGFSVD